MRGKGTPPSPLPPFIFQAFPEVESYVEVIGARNRLMTHRLRATLNQVVY